MTAPHSGFQSRLRAVAAGRVLIGAAVGVAAGWTLAGWRSAASPSSESPELARRAAVAHAVYAPEVRHPVEVGVAEKPHLIAWLSKRLEADVRAPDLSANGFALLGGRLLPAEGLSSAASLPAAQFMYENAAGRRVTLYVRNTAPHEQSGLRYARERGIGVFHWTEGGFAYALASADVGREELLRMAQAAMAFNARPFERSR